MNKTNCHKVKTIIKTQRVVKYPRANIDHISTKIPNKESNPLLYDHVKEVMIHKPCEAGKPNSPCLNKGNYTKYFPKKFTDRTMIYEDGYCLYKRRDDGCVVLKNCVELNNHFVTYNLIFLFKFSSPYLYWYTWRDNWSRLITQWYVDQEGKTINEIKMFYDCRYISPCEATWLIFGFEITCSWETSGTSFNLAINYVWGWWTY